MPNRFIVINIMKRIRTNPSIIEYGLYLHFSSSYRFARKSLELTIKRTQVTIWNWVKEYLLLSDRSVIGNRQVQKIFVDETLLKIYGQDYCWL
jgi:transposase-like protein